VLTWQHRAARIQVRERDLMGELPARHPHIQFEPRNPAARWAIPLAIRHKCVFSVSGSDFLGRSYLLETDEQQDVIAGLDRTADEQGPAERREGQQVT
jgi:hypothetical protein